MPTLRYHIVDVFSSDAYKGNPLAVVENTSDSLNTTQMQLIARQFNLSETTFVCPPTDPKATLRLRSFLPNGEEVFGAGHNSLGAWWWAADSGLCSTPQNQARCLYHQQLGQAILPVEISQSSSGTISISMQQGELQLLDSHANKAVLAETLGITAADIGLQDSAGNTVLDEVRVVTTSPARHLLVPVRSKEALDRVTFTNKERIAQELASTNSHNSGVYVFTAVDGRCDIPRFEARFFSPSMSMEDPATGSAAGPLAAYLWTTANPAILASQKTNGGIAYVEVIQGLKTGRECLMKLAIDDQGSSVDLAISGTCVLVADGNIVIPSPEIVFKSDGSC
ncbi:hypothetical protein N7474_009894 [Penicillium riverlandense]|uniref:uncharacterized protein n=1 Tax=Penicillium riverlandense TaxID=1903569 RepID=UPI002547B0D4|nr:uncharacterized protein N7474_009894 [Penicillium riverlandense]KAJ5808625.1 hypothetical protein N7474_009894 [Penicillium riverlandense]